MARASRQQAGRAGGTGYLKDCKSEKGIENWGEEGIRNWEEKGIGD